MFLSKINEYTIVQWATASYATCKERHPWFKFGAETAERVARPVVVGVIPHLPGAKSVDVLAAGTITRVEALAADVNERLGRHVDAALAMAEQRAPGCASKACQMVLGAAQVAVEAVLPVANADVERVPDDSVPRGIVQALDKHIDLAHEIRRRVLGKSPLAIALEAWTSAISIARAAPRRCIDWALAMFKRRSPHAYETSASVATRAMQEMQEIGARTTKAAEHARELVRRRVAAAAGRSGAEPDSAGETKKAEPAPAHAPPQKDD